MKTWKLEPNEKGLGASWVLSIVGVIIVMLSAMTVILLNDMFSAMRVLIN